MYKAVMEWDFEPQQILDSHSSYIPFFLSPKNAFLQARYILLASREQIYYRYKRIFNLLGGWKDPNISKLSSGNSRQMS